jgi:hypothetical protein
MPGDGLSAGDGLGNGLEVGGGADAVLDGDGEACGAGAFATAAAGPSKPPAVTAAIVKMQAAAMPAALINDYAFFAVFLAMRDF